MSFKHTDYSDKEIELLKEMALMHKDTKYNMVNPSKQYRTVDDSKMVGSDAFMETKHPKKPSPTQQKNKLLVITSKMVLFQDMVPKEITAITKGHKHEMLKKGTEVIEYGVTTNRLFFVMNGSVKKTDYDNDDVKDRIYKKGEYINIDLFLEGSTSSCDYSVVSGKCEIFSFELNLEMAKRAPNSFIKFYKNLALSLVEYTL